MVGVRSAAVGRCLVLLAVMSCGTQMIVVGAAEATPLGSSALYPAFSAKEIKLADPGAADGLYWFDPDGPGGLAPFLGYADMTADGGGWNLGLLSLNGSVSATTDMVANTGTPGLTSGHTRDMTLLAVSQAAQIRHQIVGSAGVFDAFYTGKYHDPLPAAGDWSTLAGHTNAAILSYHFGRPWSTPTVDNDALPGASCAAYYGQPWYYGACFTTIPVQNSTTYSTTAPLAPLGTSPATSYAVWVRADGATLYTDPAVTVDEPDTLVLSGLAAVLLAGLALRTRAAAS